jgi:acyl-coenzyme A synthetase/AMP-(fatty) acid ligase
VQLRALLSAAQPLPALAQVISATAPLPVELAREAEAAWGTRVLEIFGATEVGSIASRRTVEGDAWRTYRTVNLVLPVRTGRKAPPRRWRTCPGR